MTENAILGRLKRTLSPERFRHTLSVSRWAEELARIHKADPPRARLAGLLHDCAKEMPGRRLAAYVRRYRLGVPGNDFILRHKRFGLYHAYVSAHVAKRRYGVKDEAALESMERHTLGHRRMSRLDKILYIADFSAPERGFSSARRVRRLARRNLDAAFQETLRLKLSHVLQSGAALHPQTVALWNAATLKNRSGERRRGLVRAKTRERS